MRACHPRAITRSSWRAGRARLASRVFSVTESWDIASFLGRQFGAKWVWTSGLAVPHVMNKLALALEATLLIVMCVTAWARVPPASPANVLLSITFAFYYGAVVLAGAATARGLRPRLLGTLLTRRVLAPFFATVYAFVISRFGAIAHAQPATSA